MNGHLTRATIVDINVRGREIVSRRENDEHRRLEEAARGQRLRRDALIDAGLRLLRASVGHANTPENKRLQLHAHTLGRTDDLAGLDEALSQYEYLQRVPYTAFDR